MVKELISIEMERDTLNQKWGFTIQGGADLALTAKVASVKRFSPADRFGLEKMDYVVTINGKEVFAMSQPEITKEIQNSGKTLKIEIERGTFIVPSFDEIWPQHSKAGIADKKKNKKMGMEYIMEAMQHHGLGHLPQPDNFTTVGKLGIEVKQYNNPIDCYSDSTIEDMREEKVILDFPEAAEKIIAANAQKHRSGPPDSAGSAGNATKKFDPQRSAVLLTLKEQDSRRGI
ncbi:PDZ and LIM domain protein Zasp [Eurytemora carolleeae]|uniref:PDZ and LIM domain protein Zasp n=1 Tax=Eurytemora carolleeae TaxID=1294199 RepID=UPI000C76B20C|nr:PDZ and LIM domain protein Zasp [Eurytemora carolleeae]|eukprot:XP_023330302.1 PDZ and LIM domain protein Zasp-like [Eurytemora affinis]